MATTAGAVSASQRPQFRSTVELVQLQVGVADRDGSFAAGLMADDFVVLVDGDPRPVQVAYEIDLRAAETPIATSTGSALATPPIDRRPPAARRHFVLFFDFSFSSRRGVREARRAALEFIDDTLHPSDLVAVASVERAGLSLLVPFTGDHAAARRAVAGFHLRDATDLITLEDPRLWPAYVSDVARYVGYLERFGELLQAIGGRKHVVMFSAGFLDEVLRPDLETMSTLMEGRSLGNFESGFRDPASATGSTEVRASIDAAVQRLLEADAVVHAIDPRGLRLERDDWMALRPTSRTARPSGVGHEALAYFANGTGGTTHWNRNNLTPALDEIETLTSRYYMIAYEKRPDDPPTVDLEVRMRRPDVQVTSAPTRLTPPPDFTEMNEMQRQLQLAEALATTSDVRRIALDAEVVPFPDGSGGWRGLVFLEIPSSELERLAALRGDDVVELEIVAVGQSADRGRAGELRRGVGISLPDSRRTGSDLPRSFRYADEIALSDDHGHVRLLVREAKVGQLTAVTQSYQAPVADDPHAFVMEPLIVEDVATLPRDSERERFDPLQVDGRRQAPIPSPAVSPGDTVDVLLVAFGLDGAWSVDEAVAVSLESPGGDGGRVHALDTEVRGVTHSESAAATQVLLRLRVPPHLQFGTMQVRVQVEGCAAGDLHEASTSLFVIPPPRARW